MKVKLECTYCGHFWDDTIWDTANINNGGNKCKICEANKNFRAFELREEGLDFYGYRFSPKFEKVEKAVQIDTQEDMDQLITDWESD